MLSGFSGLSVESRERIYKRSGYLSSKGEVILTLVDYSSSIPSGLCIGDESALWV